MRRHDGSIRSKNNPIQKNRHQSLDNGLYAAIVISKQIPVLNVNSTTNAEMSYTVRILGGLRDGLVIPGCLVMRTAGGRNAFSDITLKAQQSPTFTELGSILNFTTFQGTENGDYVYIQFLNGNPNHPIIVGFMKSPLDGNNEIPTDLITSLPLPTGQQKIESFNGVKSIVDPNGNYQWTAGLGLYNPAIAPDINNPTAFFVNEYVPVPLSDDFFKLSVDTVLQTASFNALPGIGLDMSVLTDSVNITTTSLTALSLNGLTASATLGNVLGTGLEVSGVTDSVTLGTAVGTSVEVSGITDSITLGTLAGASVSITGITDTIELSTTIGSAISLGPLAGEFKLSTGTTLSLSPTGASLLDPIGAGFKVENGMIAMGSPAGELLAILDEFLTSMASATYAGFGAPGSNIADIIKAQVSLALIKGSL